MGLVLVLVGLDVLLLRPIVEVKMRLVLVREVVGVCQVVVFFPQKASDFPKVNELNVGLFLQQKLFRLGVLFRRRVIFGLKKLKWLFFRRLVRHGIRNGEKSERGEKDLWVIINDFLLNYIFALA